MCINNKFVDLVQMLWLFLYKFPFTQSVKMIMDEHKEFVGRYFEHNFRKRRSLGNDAYLFF